ncbi:hypothetical protein GC197_10020 [bacterium]|nr:hypothetical protein [bacterium]
MEINLACSLASFLKYRPLELFILNLKSGFEMTRYGFPLVTTLTQADADPTLTPQWRSEVAQALLDEPNRIYDSLDPGIEEAIAFLQGEELENRSAIEQATQIYEDDALLRAEIEALVLVNCPGKEIARRCGVDVKVVAFYEQLYFHVRRYLRASDWLISRTVNGAHWCGFKNHQLRQFWAWLAMAGGPVILDHAITVYKAAGGTHASCRLDTYLLHNARVSINLQTFVAILTIPADQDGLRASLDLNVRFKEIDACTNPEVRRQYRGEAQQAVIRYARLVLAGKRRKWKMLTRMKPTAQDPVDSKQTPRDKSCQNA